jgi:hypothetical protein
MAASIISLLAVLWIADGDARAAANTVMVDVNAAVASSAQLTISPLTINFPDADPDTTPVINAIGNPLTVTVQAQTKKQNTVTLTVLAQGNLVSGSSTIPISNVRWTATGAGFAPGTLSNSTAVRAGSWTGPGTRSGTFSYTMANSWNYPRGEYRATVIYTLTAP